MGAKMRDWTGKRLGKLTVIKPTSQRLGGSVMWECQCDCGENKSISTIALKAGQTSCSIGCALADDLKGQRFGNLIAISRAKSKGDALWNCLCDCGASKQITAYNLKSGHTKTCGKESIHNVREKNHTWKGCGEIGASIWHSYRNGAETRGLEFSISIEYMWDLFLQQNRKCPLSGLDIHFYPKGKLNTASLDRIDNSKGYVEGNVRWLHKDINRIKWDMSDEKLLQYVKLIYEHRLRG